MLNHHHELSTHHLSLLIEQITPKMHTIDANIQYALVVPEVSKQMLLGVIARV